MHVPKLFELFKILIKSMFIKQRKVNHENIDEHIIRQHWTHDEQRLFCFIAYVHSRQKRLDLIHTEIDGLYKNLCEESPINSQPRLCSAAFSARAGNWWELVSAEPHCLVLLNLVALFEPHENPITFWKFSLKQLSPNLGVYLESLLQGKII